MIVPFKEEKNKSGIKLEEIDDNDDKRRKII